MDIDVCPFRGHLSVQFLFIGSFYVFSFNFSLTLLPSACVQTYIRWAWPWTWACLAREVATYYFRISFSYSNELLKKCWNFCIKSNENISKLYTLRKTSRKRRLLCSTGHEMGVFSHNEKMRMSISYLSLIWIKFDLDLSSFVAWSWFPCFSSFSLPLQWVY